MIVRIARVKVGNRQAPLAENPNPALKAGFGRLQHSNSIQPQAALNSSTNHQFMACHPSFMRSVSTI
jgi:hypothetical protein